MINSLLQDWRFAWRGLLRTAAVGPLVRGRGNDPATYATIAVLPAATAAIAAWQRARRAASVDPVRALRAD